ncbi:hypothetical protein JOF58_000540 [Streptomyces cinnamonensis]|nr:hypothetical protein [Streptomyces virginiae]
MASSRRLPPPRAGGPADLRGLQPRAAASGRPLRRGGQQVHRRHRTQGAPAPAPDRVARRHHQRGRGGGVHVRAAPHRQAQPLPMRSGSAERPPDRRGAGRGPT